MTLFVTIPAFADNKPDSTGMPGDNLDLQAVLDIFKTSKSPEDFEKRLNTKDNKVNNLDLNGDNKVDYIKVVDKADGKNHALILQVPVSKTETQDVAVIAIEKTADSTAVCQIIGDKDVYGEEKIVEPYDIDHGKSTGPADEASALAPRIVFVNVWGWPCVYYMYGPAYSMYVSPWYWGYYPMWWDPWYPMYYYSYWGYMQPYHYGYYHYTNYCYVPNARNVYYAHRVNSPMVQQRYAAPRQNFAQSRSVQPVRTGAVNRPVVKSTQPVSAARTPMNRGEAVRAGNSGSRPAVAPVRTNNGQVRSVQPQRTQPQSTIRQQGSQPRIQTGGYPRQSAPVMRQPQSMPRQSMPQSMPRQSAPVMRSGGFGAGGGMRGGGGGFRGGGGFHR